MKAHSQALWNLADRSYAAAGGGPGRDAGAAAEATRQLRSALAVLSMAATQRPQSVLDHLDLLLKVRPLLMALPTALYTFADSCWPWKSHLWAFSEIVRDNLFRPTSERGTAWLITHAMIERITILPHNPGSEQCVTPYWIPGTVTIHACAVTTPI